MSHTNTYDIGDVAELSVTFKNAGGQEVDPTAVVFKVADPGGTVTQPVPVVQDGTGLYHVAYPIAAKGTHAYRAEGSGANAAAAERRFEVRRSRVLEAEAP